ncbi:maleylpyruvate isomerase family mycothiol-dependent enzyme [Streptomyces sp. 796.1]|uniref:maleylpyruvate isomerase family mycothiol-dependent enzyme n=1 Tax=Streptomyces sp. 796.1 TaxID=3163029 RepID=UPI0039C8D684
MNRADVEQQRVDSPSGEPGEAPGGTPAAGGTRDGVPAGAREARGSAAAPGGTPTGLPEGRADDSPTQGEAAGEAAGEDVRGAAGEIARLATALREQGAAVVRAVRGLDPAAAVPTCPQWRVRDLVGHIGQAHRWAARIVRTGPPTEVPDPRRADPGPPADWAAWVARGTTELITAVRRADGPVWSYFGPQPAAFWLRRMVHDACVHHADAALTAGTAFELAPELATGALDEALDLLCAPDAVALKPELAALRGDGQRLLFVPTGAPDRAWLVTRTGRGPRSSTATGAAAADVKVTAPVADLLLLLTRRLPPTAPQLTRTGDAALLDHWWEHTAL